MTAQFRLEMLKRGLETRDLAERSGLSRRVVSNVICGNCASPICRRKIENALGFPLWTKPEIFALRQTRLRLYGSDPGVLERKALDALARKFLPAGESQRPIRPRAALIARLEAFADSTANPPTENHA